MKVLKEAKEQLPVSFLTDFISKGWEEVGILKADIDAIKEVYKGTKDIEELIQTLIDAYLVCIGQMEAHLHEKDYIEFPEESKLNESKTLTEEVSDEVKEGSLEDKLDFLAKDEEEAIDGYEEIIDIVEDGKVKDNLEHIKDEEEAHKEYLEKAKEDPAVDYEHDEHEEETVEVPATHDAFEYFVDFDDPAPERLTDAEVERQKSELID